MEKSRREEILDAFIDVGRGKGLDYTTMKDIAKEVGISVGTIYLYFKSKEDLVEAFCQKIFQKADDYFTNVMRQPSGAEQLLYSLTVGTVALISQDSRDNRSLFDFFHNDVIKYVRKKNIVAHRQNFESQRIAAIKIALSRGIEEGAFFLDDIEVTARMIFLAFGCFFGPMGLIRAHDELIADAEQMFAFLLRGLKKEAISNL